MTKEQYFRLDLNLPDGEDTVNASLGLYDTFQSEYEFSWYRLVLIVRRYLHDHSGRFTTTEMAEVLREAGGDFEAGVEIWDMGEARALVLSGAAYPRSRQSMDSRIRSLPADAAARLTDSDVRRMADGLRTDIILEGRTPWGLTELVGQAWDSGHGPDGVELLLSNLASLSHQQVLGFLQSLANAIPLREELHP